MVRATRQPAKGSGLLGLFDVIVVVLSQYLLVLVFLSLHLSRIRPFARGPLPGEKVICQQVHSQTALIGRDKPTFFRDVPIQKYLVVSQFPYPIRKTVETKKLRTFFRFPLIFPT